MQLRLFITNDKKVLKTHMLTVVLTGGKSRRMGRDKAVLPLAGGTMSGLLIEKYKALGEVAVAVDEAGRFPCYGAVELVDEYPGQGPINGIISAFSKTDAPIIFMTATDLPNGEPGLATKLIDLICENDAVVIIRENGKLEPLFAVYKRSCLNAAKSAIEGDGRSLANLFDRVKTRYVSEDELREWDLGRVLLNVNTPEELGKL